METPSRSNRTKFVAILALAVLGSLAVSYGVFSTSETELLVKSSTSQNVSAAYASWKKQFNATYGGPEDAQRLKIFTKTFDSVNTINAKNLSYTLGLNQFSAMSDEEFASTRLGLNSKLFRASGNATKLPTANLKTSIDWTGKGAVQKVKNQGSCGSCWAFSAVGALEGAGAIKGGKLQDFAEQELVDCSRSYGNNGCSGGLMTSAFRYVKDKGITTQDKYAYKAVDATCKAITGDKFKISGHVEVPANSAAQLKAALNKQPVAVAIQASATIFRNYKTGVLTGSACGTALNHGVLAVGYETTGTPYYKVKNSWGTTWGDQGYIKIGIEEGAGVCGIQKMSSYPTA